MQVTVRALGEHLHQVIVLSEQLAKEVEGEEDRAAGLDATLDRLSKLEAQVVVKSKEVESLADEKRALDLIVAEIKAKMAAFGAR